MKCINCNVAVSPNFVAAIIENKCPACGQQMMDGLAYNELMVLRKEMVPLNLGLDESALTKIAAAITSRFKVWPRDTSETSSEVSQPIPMEVPGKIIESAPMPNVRPKPPKPIRPKSQQDAEQLVRSRMPGIEFDEAEIPLSIDEYEEDISSPSAAEAIKEWGLDKGEVGAVAMTDTRSSGDPVLNEMFSDIPMQGDMPVPGSSNRMQRAKALQGTAGMHGIKPMTNRRS